MMDGHTRLMWWMIKGVVEMGCAGGAACIWCFSVGTVDYSVQWNVMSCDDEGTSLWEVRVRVIIGFGSGCFC